MKRTKPVIFPWILGFFFIQLIFAQETEINVLPIPDYYSLSFNEVKLSIPNGPSDAWLNPALLSKIQKPTVQVISTSEILGNNISGIMISGLQYKKIMIGVGLFSNYSGNSDKNNEKIINQSLDFGNLYGFMISLSTKMKHLFIGWTWKLDYYDLIPEPFEDLAKPSYSLSQIGGLFFEISKRWNAGLTVQLDRTWRNFSGISPINTDLIRLGFSYSFYKSNYSMVNLLTDADIYNSYQPGVDVGIQTKFNNIRSLLYEMEFTISLNNINNLNNFYSLDDYLTRSIPQLNLFTGFTIPLFNQKTIRIGYCYLILNPYPNQHILSTIIQL
jgi:hypothetical protein